MYSGVVIGVDELGGYVVVDYMRNEEVSIIHNYIRASNIGSIFLKDLKIDFSGVNNISKELVNLVISRYQDYLVVIKDAKINGYVLLDNGDIEVDVDIVFYSDACTYMDRWCSDKKLSEHQDTFKVILKKIS